MNRKNVIRKCYLSISFVILFCVLTMSGCNSSPPGSSDKTLSGKYVDEINPQNFIEFKSDGTFSLHKANNKYSGIYGVVGKDLTLVLSNGKSFKGKIEGKTIIGDGGGRSTKQ